jgi:hypothetical protein
MRPTGSHCGHQRGERWHRKHQSEVHGKIDATVGNRREPHSGVRTAFHAGAEFMWSTCFCLKEIP